MTKSKVYFILSCARSGSTSLARILDSADNGVCLTEPYPNLNIESRKMDEGRLPNPESILVEQIKPRVLKHSEQYEVYGEKNVTYGPFIKHLYNLFNCKFVFLKRDGRDVVRSLIDWHEQLFGNVYRECIDPGNLSKEAIASIANLPIHLDTYDFARPRPMQSEPLHARWLNLSRFEMCTYYWTHSNNLYLDMLEQVPKDCWMELDYTRANADDLLQVAEFLKLRGLEKSQVDALLNKRINSLKERCNTSNRYPRWEDWGELQREQFDSLAAETMVRLGYYKKNDINWCPVGYGDYWREHEGGLEWYEWMYDSRKNIHRQLVEWVEARDSAGDAVETIADFGCGLGVGYCDDFKDKHYTGFDLSKRNIQWCKNNRNNPLHDYCNLDFIRKRPENKFDLVFSSGTLDNSCDMNKFVEAMVLASKRFIHITCFRGWFPELQKHKYHYVRQHKYFDNDVSPHSVRRQLAELGCTDISISPIATGNRKIPFETLITARVP